MDVHVYLEKFITWALTSGPHILITLFLTFIALKAATTLSNRFNAFALKKTEEPEFQKRTQTLASIIRYSLSVLILIVAAMIVLKELGVEIGPILAAAGIAGLAVGFGAQNLVKDVISGFFILLEDQVRVGDVVQVAGKTGVVENVQALKGILEESRGSLKTIRLILENLKQGRLQLSFLYLPQLFLI